MTYEWEVIVGNVGSVYAGTDRASALAKFDTYVALSKANVGRAAGENVVLLQNNAIVKEHDGVVATDEN